MNEDRHEDDDNDDDDVDDCGRTERCEEKENGNQKVAYFEAAPTTRKGQL